MSNQETLMIVDCGYRQKVTFKMLANQSLEKGEVHYLDLSSETNKFDGLLLDCNLYGNTMEYSSFLQNMIGDLNDRISLFEKGESLDQLPYVFVVVADLASDVRKESLQKALDPFLCYLRAINYVLVV